jgi:hypothetical protein
VKGDVFMKEFCNTGCKEYRDLGRIPFRMSLDIRADDLTVGCVRLEQFGLKKRVWGFQYTLRGVDWRKEEWCLESDVFE